MSLIFFKYQALKTDLKTISDFEYFDYIEIQFHNIFVFKRFWCLTLIKLLKSVIKKVYVQMHNL